jgi:hypothetical protein
MAGEVLEIVRRGKVLVVFGLDIVHLNYIRTGLPYYFLLSRLWRTGWDG